MAITVKKIVEATTAAETENGWVASDFYLVSGIAAPAKCSYLATINVPAAIGQPHNFIPGTNCISRGVHEIHGTGEKVTVRVDYGRPGGGGTPKDAGPGGVGGAAVLQTGSQVESVTSNKSIKEDGTLGGIILVAFKPDGNTASHHSPGVGEVAVARPRGTISYTRKESSRPLDKAIKFTGFTNSTPWPPNTFHNDPEKWMCTGIEGGTDDGGETYTVTYEFMFKEEGHHQTVVFVDPVTGWTPTAREVTDPPTNKPDAAGNGTLVVRVAGKRDFNELKLT